MTRSQERSEPSTPSFRQFITAGKNDEFTHGSGTREIFEPIPALFPVGMMPGEGQEQEHERKDNKKPA